MPILEAETACFPDHLLKENPSPDLTGRKWWVLHTRPRQEKSLSRDLLRNEIPFYLPITARRSRQRGRTMTSHLPLFSGYVFLLAGEEERVVAQRTGRIANSLPVLDGDGLWRDLRQIHRLINSGMPLTPEEHLAPGMEVEIKSGSLAGMKGRIIRASSGRRFVVAVDFIQRGASVLLDDFTLALAQK